MPVSGVKPANVDGVGDGRLAVSSNFGVFSQGFLDFCTTAPTDDGQTGRLDLVNRERRRTCLAPLPKHVAI